ncbi:aquaporin Z [Pseudarthrobacter sp. PvP004]|jgi:aquaporin Z|uniref:Aquaporin Z n=1 Tax=Paenarthrobacter aurescens (strain TC1) TaxID=290340 RepID=A1R7R8_PAEAT|nr:MULTISPECIES: aquaporin [Micrococcaceae]ABM06648.1 aquaporin Z [Paenarthrobacter aurescens TC1]MBP2265335.1 aquaporin Z [Pseudarthrobacter sp. PvP004]
MTSPVQATPEPQPGLVARLSAEALGSMFVVVAAVGVGIFSNPGAAPLPAALATGLTVTAAMLAFGYVSGGHFNPAITLGNLIAGRIRAVAAVAYVAAQIIGSVVGAALMYFVVTTVPVLTDARAAFDVVAPGFGDHASAQTQMAGVLLVEVLGSALLVAVFLGATAGRRALPAMAPFAVGLAMAVLLQLGQVLGNLPFNPARATAQAFFSSPWAIEGLWLFWVAPLMGAALAGLAFRGFQGLSQAAVADTDHFHGGTDGINDAFDADDEPAEDSEVKEEAAAKADIAPSRAVPTVPVTDDARDFFDGKKGK